MLRAILLASTLALTAGAPALTAAAQVQAAQAPATASPPAAGGYVRPAPPGRLVDVGGGRRLHILCKGEAAAGAPMVIFEAGLSQYAANTTYGLAQDAVVAAVPGARVCTYDRAGMGWSDAAPAGWTLDGMTADLHALLAAAGIEGRVVLVGHSFGGLLARTYAKAHPSQVAGIVLVDATSDVNFAEFDAAAAAVIPQIDQALASATPGVPVIGLPPGTSPEVVMSFTPEILRGVKVEFEAWGRLPAAMKQPGGFGTLGDTPLIVIRRGKTSTPPSADDLRHQQGQAGLAALSSNSALIVAENSGHTIPLDEPQVVAGAVKRMLEAVKTGGRVK